MANSRQNHFELFSLPQSFSVDTDLLDDRARHLLGQWHPDRFVDAEDSERLRSVQMTSLINEARETLHKPLSRAGYLLSLEGIDPDSFSQNDLGGEFLMRQMHLRDDVEAAEAGDNIDLLDDMKRDIRKECAIGYQSFAKALEGRDLTSAKTFFHQLQFMEKLLTEINQSEERLLDY